MAAGDHTLIDIKGQESKPEMRFKVYDINITDTYATGGYVITPNEVGLTVILGATIISQGVSAGITYQWIPATSAVKAFWVDTTVDGAAQAEVPNATSLSTPRITVVFWGYLA